MNLVQTPTLMNPISNSAPAMAEPTRMRRARGLVNTVVENLSNRIRNGEIKPATKLPTESEIMLQFDVSRTVVREAISHLQANRLVETRHGIGTFALSPQENANFQISNVDFETVADVIALLELRISLETEAAGLAAQRRSPEHIKTMQNLLHDFETAVQNEANTVPSDFSFHLEVAKATGNRHFADLMTYLGTMVIPRTRVNTDNNAPEGRLSYLKRVHGEHETIYNAILNQDADAARAAMRTHLSNSKDRLRKAQSAL